MENVDRVVDEEEEAGRNPPTSDRRNPLNNSFTTPHRPPPQLQNRKESGSNLRYSETETLCTESPFQVIFCI